MRAVIKLCGISLGLILILSITFRDRTLFSHIYELTSPVTIYAQESVEEFFTRSITGTQDYSRKIFDNSVPKLRDSVKSKLSASTQIDTSVPQDKISDEDKEVLDQLIKNH